MPRGIRSITGKGRSTRGSARGRRAGSGVMREVGSKAGVQQQNTRAARQSRKAEGKNVADLKQPAMNTFGETAEAADTKIRPSQVAAKQANEFDKALKAKKKELEKRRNQLNNSNLTGKDRYKFVETYINPLKNAIENMEERGGPGGKTKRKRKKISKAGGGKAIPEGNKGKGVRALVASGPKGKQAAKEMGFAVAKKGGRIVTAMTGGQIVSMMYDD